MNAPPFVHRLTTSTLIGLLLVTSIIGPTGTAIAAPADEAKCDQLAASPGDPGNSEKGVPGVDLSELRKHVQEALLACRAAMKGSNELRYRYLLGRARLAEREYAIAENLLKPLEGMYNKGALGQTLALVYFEWPRYANAVPILEEMHSLGAKLSSRNLARIYAAGDSTLAPDTAKTLQWATEAEQRGNSNIYWEIATLSELKKGRGPNIDQARVFYRMAADRGDERAVKWLWNDGVKPALDFLREWIQCQPEGGHNRIEVTAGGMDFTQGQGETLLSTVLNFSEIDPRVKIAGNQVQLSCAHVGCIATPLRPINTPSPLSSVTYEFCSADVATRFGNALTFMIIANGGEPPPF